MDKSTQRQVMYPTDSLMILKTSISFTPVSHFQLGVDTIDSRSVYI
jgi:hypothetical protein